MVSFDNTEISFAWRSTNELRRAKLLFRTIGSPTIVGIGNFLLKVALWLGVPISWAVKPTIFKQFVGGETLQECNSTIGLLAKYSVKSILDYSVEGKDNPQSHESAYNEIMKSVENAALNKNITYAVFKPTGLIAVSVLEAVSKGAALTELEKEQYHTFLQRVDKLCMVAHSSNTPILIDAEDSWYQKAIDDLAANMMQKYNKEQAVVYNTLQMYRADRLNFLKESHDTAKKQGYKLGIKLVRGAYMEKERARAQKYNYPSPIHPTKADTDIAFNAAQEFAITNISNISIFCGTHNELSVRLLVDLMDKHDLHPTDSRISFAQLFGMSDNISFTLASLGYNVAKYIPYGPVKEVLPYLIRRAQENTSVKGQTGRELALILEELKRRSIYQS